MSGTTLSERCSWCGRDVDSEDGYRLGEWPGERLAVFCRLEHVVPWAMQGPHWEAGRGEEPVSGAAGGGRCAHCETHLGEVRLELVRHRGEHRIPDRFCSVDHLAAWASAGGRWR